MFAHKVGWGFKVEWFGPPKSLTFNRLKVSTETTIKLNTTYLLRCKFDPFYYLPLRCILSWMPWSWLTALALLLLWLWVIPKTPLSLHLRPWPKFTPHNYHWSSQLSPHRHQPPLHWLVKISKNAQTTMWRFDDASIGGWRSSIQALLWNTFRKSEGKSFWDCITAWMTSS